MDPAEVIEMQRRFDTELDDWKGKFGAVQQELQKLRDERSREVQELQKLRAEKSKEVQSVPSSSATTPVAGNDPIDCQISPVYRKSV